jgi:Tfp pilus assembly protein PilN
VIRGNLATRPFYNERVASLVIALFAALVLLLTLFNVYGLVSLSARNTALAAEIRQEEEAAERMRQQAAALRRRINQNELRAVMAGAREANALIDQRTFSWTEFFNLIERTLPENVMLTSVRPAIEENRTTVHMSVIGRRAEDIDAFMEQLEKTKSFRSVQPRSEDVTEEGLHRVALSAEYEPDSQPTASGGGGAQAPAAP